MRKKIKILLLVIFLLAVVAGSLFFGNADWLQGNMVRISSVFQSARSTSFNPTADIRSEVVTGEVTNSPYELGKITPLLRGKLVESDLEGFFEVVVVLKEQADVRDVKGDYKAVMQRFKATARKRESNRDPNAFGNVVQQLVRDREVELLKKYTIVNAYSLKSSFKGISTLDRHPEIEVIDAATDIILDVDDPFLALEKAYEGVNMIRASEVWAQGYKGSGSKIGFIDTGVYAEHPALEGKIDLIQVGSDVKPAFKYCTDPQHCGDTFEFIDPYERDITESHGTHVIGIAVGGKAVGGSDSVDLDKTIGVAPEASYLASNALPYESLEWMIDPDGDPETDDRPVAVSNSYNFVSSKSLKYWIDAVEAAGVLVIFSAGNEGASGIHYIHTYPTPLLVANAIDMDTIKWTSSQGPVDDPTGTYLKPDLAAPGTGILSSVYPGAYPGMEPDVDSATAIYKRMDGTSMAAPAVAGAVALIQEAYFEQQAEANPEEGGSYLSPSKIKSILQLTAVNMFNDDGKDILSGSGMIDVVAAIDLAKNHATLKGRVTNNVGNEIPFAIISLVYDGLNYELYTDKDGYYEFALPFGAYDFSYHKKLHDVYEKKLNLGDSNAVQTLDVTLAGPSVHIVFSGTEINFEPTLVGETGYAIGVKIYNLGYDVVEFSDVIINNEHFELMIPKLPFIVEPYGSIELGIKFVPKSVGDFSATAKLISDIGIELPDINLHGFGFSDHFKDVAEAVNVHDNVHTNLDAGIFSFGDVYWSDLNADNRQDLLFSKGGSPAVFSLLGLNGMDSFFTQAADWNGLGKLFSDEYRLDALRVVDIDNDGDQDVLAGIQSWYQNPPLPAEFVVFLNDGQGYFSEEVALDVMPRVFDRYSQLAVADFNNDGWLDIANFRYSEDEQHGVFVYFQSSSNPLTFEKSIIMADATFSQKSKFYNLYPFDYNQDSFPDLLSAGSLGGAFGDILIYKNINGKTFELIQNLGTVRGSDMAFKDYDHDGDLDVYLQNRQFIDPDGSVHDFILVNRSDTMPDQPFERIEGLYTVSVPDHFSKRGGVTWADYDNDGNSDVFFGYCNGSNLLFEDSGDHQSYEEVAFWLGIGSGSTCQHHSAWADYDSDGDLDVYAVDKNDYNALYHNQYYETEGDHHWLALHLEGTTSNRDAIGARVKLYFKDGSLMSDQVLTTHQSTGQDPRILHFGLGDKTADDILTIIIDWPSGIQQHMRPESVDQLMTIIEANCPSVTLMEGVNFLCVKQPAAYTDGSAQFTLAAHLALPGIMRAQFTDANGIDLPPYDVWRKGKSVTHAAHDNTQYTFTYLGMDEHDHPQIEFVVNVDQVSDCNAPLQLQSGTLIFCPQQTFTYANDNGVSFIGMVRGLTPGRLGVTFTASDGIALPSTDSWHLGKEQTYTDAYGTTYHFNYFEYQTNGSAKVRFDVSPRSQLKNLSKP